MSTTDRPGSYHDRMMPALARLVLAACLVSLAAWPSLAQEPEDDLGFSNETELSAVATFGNASTDTLGLRNFLEYRWPQARYALRVETVRSSSAGDKFLEVVPQDAEGVETVRVVRPGKSAGVEKYLIENVYDQQIRDALRWQAGLTWDRNEDAGLLNRYVAFTGLGHLWWDRDDRHFETSYSLAYVDREEASPDPEKDPHFAALRLAWDFWDQWGENARLSNDATFNVNATEASDWSVDTTTAVTIDITDHLALRSSLQWLYNHRPALQDIGVVVVGPGDVDIGSVRILKERLDTVFTNAVVVSF